MYDKNIGFTTSQRTDFSKRDHIPGPTQYNTMTDWIDKKYFIQFKSGRDVIIFICRNVKQILCSKPIQIRVQVTINLKIKINLKGCLTLWVKEYKLKIRKMLRYLGLYIIYNRPCWTKISICQSISEEIPRKFAHLEPASPGEDKIPTKLNLFNLKKRKTLKMQ